MKTKRLDNSKDFNLFFFFNSLSLAAKKQFYVEAGAIFLKNKFVCSGKTDLREFLENWLCCSTMGE